MLKASLERLVQLALKAPQVLKVRQARVFKVLLEPLAQLGRLERKALLVRQDRPAHKASQERQDPRGQLVPLV